MVPSVNALTNVCATPVALPASPTFTVTVVLPPEDVTFEIAKLLP